MLKKFATDLQQIKTVSELMDYIPHRALETAAYALLCALCLLPLFSMINCALFGERVGDAAMQLIGMTYQYTWASLVKMIGLLGLILGAIALGKSVLAYRRTGKTAKEFWRQYAIQLLLAALLLWSTLSCLLSDNISRSLLGDKYRQEGLLTYFAYYGIFAMAYLLRGDRRRIRILGVLALFALPIAAGIIFEDDWLRLVLNFRNAEHANPFMNINHAAYYLCLALMCAASRLMLSERKRLELLLWGAVFAVLATALLINQSLGPYLAVVLGLAVLLVAGLIMKQGIWKRALSLCLIFAVVTGIYMLSTERLANDTEELANDVTAIAEDNETVQGKRRFRPLAAVGGGGWIYPGTPCFRLRVPTIWASNMRPRGIELDRPHCVPLQIAASLGLPALLFYLAALIVYIIRFCQRGPRTAILDLMLFATGAAYVASSLVGNSAFYTTPYFCLIWGMALRFTPLKTQDGSLR